MEGVSAAAFRKLFPEDYLDRFLAEGLRPDGRAPTAPRDLSVHVGGSQAPGSALVKLGGTTVVTTVALDLLEDEDNSGMGRLGHSLDLGPLGAAQSRNAAKSRQLVASTSGRVQRALEACVDLSRLCLGGDGVAKCWGLRAKSTCLALDGGLLDATLASAVAALATLRLPRLEEIDALSPTDREALAERALAASDTMACDDTDGGKGAPLPSRVPFRCVPACVSLALYKGHLLVDPTREEEALASAHVAAVLTSTKEAEKVEGQGETQEFLLVEATADGKRAPRVGGEVMHRCLAIAAKRAEGRHSQLEALVARCGAADDEEDDDDEEEDDEMET